MVPIIMEEIGQIPPDIVDLESFRRWSRSRGDAQRGWVSFLNGEIWVDTSMEQPFVHNRVKTQLTIMLGGLVEGKELGYYFSDGVLLSNEEANLSTEPDGSFCSFAAIESERVSLVEGTKVGYVEIEGTPDMVLEVVSRSSVDKDTVVLRQAYAEAGIREYWLVDGRQEPLRFDILRRSARGYVASRKRSGWLRSEVFDRWFRLTQQPGSDGFPLFTLDMQTQRPGSTPAPA